MELADTHSLVDRVAALDFSAVLPLTRWLEWMTLECVRVGSAVGLDDFSARRWLRRLAVIERFPLFAAAMADGVISAAHLDVLAAAIRHLEPAVSSRLVARSEFLVSVAARVTPNEFARTVKAEIVRLDAKHENAVAERQRRAISLRHWVDPSTGMVCLRGEFDPERAALLLGRLNNTIESLFHTSVPDGCPTDPIARRDHLAALALLALTEIGGTGRAGDVDLVVIIDHQTLVGGVHDSTVNENSAGVDLPVDTVRRMACMANIIPTVMGSDGVVVDLGRSVRLANRAQRRALRAMYSCCAIDGCHVRFEHCQPHHLHPWEAGGATDLSNLLPLCSRHHHAAHEGGWKLALDPRTRVLTVNRPDGTTQTTGPPRARVAA